MAELQVMAFLPIAAGIEEMSFVSPYDQTKQTYLQKNFYAGTDTVLLAVIYLHGALAHQEQGMSAGIFDGAFEKWGAELARRNALYVCPEYRGGSWMGPAAEVDLIEIIREVEQRFSPQKTILFGASMGGTSALIFAVRHPKMIDGIIALCPATDPALMFDRFSDQFCRSYGGSPTEIPKGYLERRSRDFVPALKNIPIAIVHGEADAVIPVEHSRIMVEHLKAAGGRYLYHEQPGGHHDTPLSFAPSQLLDFILA